MSQEKILIVEQNLFIATELADTLVKSGYEVVGIVGSGGNAISMANHIPLDLVLLDVMLKGSLDGISTAAEIRSKQDLPIIYMAPCTNEELNIQSRYILPFGILTKPVQQHNLLAIIRRAIIYHAWGKIPTENISQCYNQYKEMVCPSENNENLYHMKEQLIGYQELKPDRIAY